MQRKRIKRVDTENAATTTTYYLDSVEYILHPNGISEYKRYLGNAAIAIVRSNGTKELSYLHQDHLGSLDVISNSQGQKTECLSFDAFGKRRQCSGWNPVTDAFAEISLSTILAITPRGFTGHEHIDHAEVIHMNGRIYDPINGRFMQADPIVQAPDHSQSPNRYSYVFNNPLSYTDPTGFEALVNLHTAMADWRPMQGNQVNPLERSTRVLSRNELKKKGLLPAKLSNQSPVDAQASEGDAKKVDRQQTGPNDRRFAQISKHVYGIGDAALPSGVNKLRPDLLEDLGLHNLIFNDEASGFQSSLYYDSNTGQYIYAFAGTQNGTDWTENFAQGLGQFSKQYDLAIINTQRIRDATNGALHLTGHSLGGGLASAAAIITNTQATTFNAAGVNPSTISRYGGNMSEANHLINAYYVKGEVLNALQSATGRQRVLNAANPIQWWHSAGNKAYRSIQLHSINEVIASPDWQK